MSTENVSRLRSSIESAINTNLRHHRVQTVSIYFEADTTGAKADAKSFCQNTSRLFGAISTECILNNRPINDFSCHMTQHLEDDGPVDFGRGPRQDLLILHYSGHGRLLPGVKLDLCSGISGARSLQYNVVDAWITDFQIAREYLDVLVILDARHSAAGQYRGHFPSSYELIWATTETQTTNARDGKLSFTQKLLGALNDINSMPDKLSVDPVEIVTFMQAKHHAESDPGHKVMKGGKRLLLYFTTGKPEIGRGSVDEGNAIAQAIISIKIPEDPDSIMAQGFISKLRSMSNDVLDLKILSVHRVRSTLIILQARVGWALRVSQTAPAETVTLLGIVDVDPAKKKTIITTDREVRDPDSSSLIECSELWAQGSTIITTDREVRDPDSSSPIECSELWAQGSILSED